MCYRLYVSCMLSLLKSMTLSNPAKKKLAAASAAKGDSLLFKLYAKEKADCVTLWHLPPPMSGYVAVLVAKARKALAASVSDASHSLDLTDETLDSIMASAYQQFDDLKEDYD